MRRALALGVVLGAALGFGSCGGDSTTTVTHTATALLPSSVALNPCTRAEGSGSNWGARVSGISCDQVGQFIERSIFPVSQTIESVERGQTIHFQAGGHVCEASKNTKPTIGGWNVACTRGDQHFAFYLTP
jgi:hypothetical protein